MSRFSGVGTALVTPFRDGAVDYKAYGALIERQVRLGVDFLVPIATTAETPALSTEEKVELLKIARSASQGRPLLVGCGSNALAPTLENMKLLEPYGPDGWLVVVPFYNKPTQEGQYLYFKAVASATSLPVVIYNVPGRTGANMLPSTCLRLARECPNIVGIKEASGNFEQICEILAGSPEGFDVLSGDDDMTVSLMKKGAAGVISVASNVLPSLVSDMVHAAASGDWAAADALDERLHPFFKACFVESNPIPVKAALEHLGYAHAEVRLPLSEATSQTKALVSQVLDSLL